ncbi:unnamed protein product [Prunus armeniaca]
MTLVLSCACVTRVGRAARGRVASFPDASGRGDFWREISRRRRFPACSNHCVNKMSETESHYSDSLRAFEGESVSKSSTAGLGSVDSEGAEGVGGAEVCTDSGSTSSVKVVEVNKSQPSTSGLRVGAIEADASIVDPREGVLTVVTDQQRVPVVKLKGLVFGVDFLEPNTLNEAKLAVGVVEQSGR